MEGLGDIGADLLALRAGVEIESRMLLATLAPAIRLTTRAIPKHERAAEKRFVGEDFSGGDRAWCSGWNVESVKSSRSPVLGEELYAKYR